MNISLISNWGFILLALWLIISGTLKAFSIGNMVISVLLAVVSVVAGVLILLGK